MVKSQISDREWETVLAFCVSQDMNGLHKYLDSLFYTRGLGTDGCSRPLAFREKAHLEHTCFAVGYLDKVLSFVIQSNLRNDPITNTFNYIEALKEEIRTFFKK